MTNTNNITNTNTTLSFYEFHNIIVDQLKTPSESRLSTEELISLFSIVDANEFNDIISELTADYIRENNIKIDWDLIDFDELANNNNPINNNRLVYQYLKIQEIKMNFKSEYIRFLVSLNFKNLNELNFDNIRENSFSIDEVYLGNILHFYWYLKYGFNKSIVHTPLVLKQHFNNHKYDLLQYFRLDELRKLLDKHIKLFETAREQTE